MGSKRSGKRGQRSYLIKTSEALELDIRKVMDAGEITEGTVKRIHWMRKKSIVFTVEVLYEESSVRLSYTYSQHGVDGIWEEYSIPITWSQCHFGGKRPWFLCRRCNRRVGRLYLNRQRYFFCRHCVGLKYESQYEDATSRMVRKAEKIRKRLDWEPSIFKRPSGRPKHMRWATYFRWHMEYCDLVEGVFRVWKMEAGIASLDD